MQVSKRISLFFLTIWLFTCQTGLAWSVSTCLFTGQKKIEIGKTVKCCKMPSAFNKEGLSSNLHKKSCCKLEQHVLKLNSDFEKKISTKKIFQSFVKKIIFFEIFFSKTHFFSQKLSEVTKIVFWDYLKNRLSFLQLFLI